MLYTLTHPLVQKPFKLEVWMQHRPSSKPALNISLKIRGGWDPNSWPLITSASDTTSSNQLNQKLKLMAEAKDMLHTLTHPLTREPFD